MMKNTGIDFGEQYENKRIERIDHISCKVYVFRGRMNAGQPGSPGQEKGMARAGDIEYNKNAKC